MYDVCKDTYIQLFSQLSRDDNDYNTPKYFSSSSGSSNNDYKKEDERQRQRKIPVEADLH